jgi:hypothetical protein
MASMTPSYPCTIMDALALARATGEVQALRWAVGVLAELEVRELKILRLRHHRSSDSPNTPR